MKLWVHVGECYEKSSYPDERLWFITAIWPVPGGERVGKMGSPLIPINLPVKTYNAKTGKEVKSAAPPGQAFMLPPRQDFNDGQKVYLSPVTGFWCSARSKDVGFKTRTQAENHGFKVVAAKPYWIGKLSVERL